MQGRSDYPFVCTNEAFTVLFCSATLVVPLRKTSLDSSRQPGGLDAQARTVRRIGISCAQPCCTSGGRQSTTTETAILLRWVAGVYMVTARIHPADTTRSGKAWPHEAIVLRTSADKPSCYIPRG